MKSVERVNRLISSYFSRHPSYLILFVTSRCNAKCKMCFNWEKQQANQQGEELTLSEIEKISKGFKNLYQFTIGGGEPFLRDDLPEIVRFFYVNSGARRITISTNAFFTDKIEKGVRQILEECPACLLKVGLSVDAVGQKHDNIRQLPGSFDNFLSTHERLRRIKKDFENLVVEAVTVVSKYNLGLVEELLEYVSKNLKVDDHALLLARGNTRDPAAVEVPIKRYKELLKRVDGNAGENLKKRKDQFSRVFYGLNMLTRQVVFETIEKSRMVYPCLAGRKLVEIYADGLVVPCEILAVIKPGVAASLGNIRDFDYDIQQVLRSPKAKEIVRLIRDSRCFCSFECAIITNIVFNPYMYPRLIRCMFSKNELEKNIKSRRLCAPTNDFEGS